MSERDVILSKINIIKNCLYAIDRVKNEEKDPFFQIGLYELNLQRAIQGCIDIANVIIAREGLGLPSSYRQSFSILGAHQIIPTALEKKLIQMVGFRNISVHDYGEVKPEIVRGIIDKHLIDFEDYYSLAFEYTKKWSATPQ